MDTYIDVTKKLRIIHLQAAVIFCYKWLSIKNEKKKIPSGGGNGTIPPHLRMALETTFKTMKNTIIGGGSQI